MKKRILGILLTLCMVLCIVPTGVFAAERAATGTAAISVNTRRILSPTKVTNGNNVHFVPNSYIYFGINGTAPIKWRVLDAEKACNGDTNNMFLLSEYLLSNNVRYNSIVGTSAYNTSDAQFWCRDFASSKNGGTFTDPERDAMRVVSKTDSAEKLYGLSWGQGGLSNIDNLFFLSVREATDYIGNYDNAPGLTATDMGGNADSWWLRSPIGSASKAAGLVHSSGVIDADTINYIHAARPAFNLSKYAVRMISAAAGGKSASGTEKGLTAIPAYSGNEWKLTLFDSARKNFRVLTSDVTASTDGGTVRIDYTGAKTGDNEYVSAILFDENQNPLCYGRSMQSVKAENGTAELAVPAGLAQGEYTLSVFSEQYNGDYKTDYASNYFSIRFTVEKTPAEQLDLTPGGKYYFDLSGESIPGAVNGALPDGTLHYVPFTYAGTVNAYVLKAASDGVIGSSGSASRTTDPAREYGYTYPHSLFVADYTVTQNIGWDSLNAAGFIFGKAYQSGDISYTLRAPTVGSNRSGTIDSENERGTPLRNEWDTILDKNGSLIKNWAKTDSWGQDSSDANAGVQALYRAYRGFVTARTWSSYPKGDNRIAYRPVLEVQNAATLGKNGIKAVTLDLSGNTLDGEDSIKIVIKSGKSFTAPAAEGLPRSGSVPVGASLRWADESGNLYEPGDTVPASVSKLSVADGYTVTYLPGAYGTGSAVTDIKPYDSILTLRGTLFTRSGYTQTGWAAIDGGEKVYNFEDVYTADEALTLYPVWTPNRYTVTLDGNGGTPAQSTVTATYGEPLDQMPIPRYKGYFFLGWYDQKWGGRQYSDKYGHSTTRYDKAGDCTLYAMWEEAPLCTVTFDPNGGTLTGAATCEEKQNECIREPSLDEWPVREGHNFLGWYTDAACKPEQKWDFDDPIPGNMTLYAGWDILSYVIRVKFANGEPDSIIDQNYDTAITVPDDPTREGYTFIGWDTPFPKKMPAKIMEITALWQINRYKITFDTDGGSEIDPIEQDYDTEITAPDNPTKEGYAFIDWDTTVPAKMPAKDMTVKALWKDIEKPTGKISLDTNEWKTLLNTITFGLFFKDTQTVTITATDNSGDAVKIEYLLPAKALTEAELADAAFTVYTAPSFSIDPDNEYIIYVRLTDTAGNTAYICSDGIVLDGTSPVIKGIENGKTYCEAQNVTIDEKYIDTVIVNETKVTLDESGSFVLSPADGEQKIIVTDKAGNSTEMTVTVNDGHTLGEWTSNGDGTHTRQCTVDGCTEGVETDNCTDEDKNHICDICGNIISNHEDANQDHVCDLCGKVISNHEDADKDHICDLCGKTISNHEDADKDHICDHCGKVISNHEDANKDHVCDLCGKTISNHEDANKDHVCDYCGKVFSNHEDADKDHVCDCCGKVISNHEDADNNHICDYCEKVISNHEDADKDHVCDYCGKVITNHIGGKETCRDKAVCEVCGKSYGELDPNNHTDLKHFPAKAATEDSEGNIEYWYCSGCNKYYRGKDGTKEIAKADTVTAKLPKSPPTGDNSNLMLWIALLFISGGVLTGVTVFDKRKRHSVK